MGTHPEKKFSDASVTISPDATGQSTTACVIPQGAGDSDRVGRKCIVTDFLLKGHIAWGPTTGASPLTGNRVRFILVQDTQPNLLLPTAAQVFGSSADINSYMKLVNAKRFKFLFDRTYTRNGKAGHGDGTTNDFGGYFLPISFNLKPCIDFEFDEDVDTAGTVASQTINSLTFISFEEASSPATTIHFIQRVRFVD